MSDSNINGSFVKILNFESSSSKLSLSNQLSSFRNHEVNSFRNHDVNSLGGMMM